MIYLAYALHLIIHSPQIITLIRRPPANNNKN